MVYESKHNPMDQSETDRMLRVLKSAGRPTLVEGFRLVETAEALRKNVMRLADENVKHCNHVKELEAEVERLRDVQTRLKDIGHGTWRDEWKRAERAETEVRRLSEPCPCCGGLGQMDPGSHAACDPCGGTGRQPKGAEQAETEIERLRMSPCTVGSFHENGSHKCGLQVEIDRLKADSAGVLDLLMPLAGQVAVPAEKLIHETSGAGDERRGQCIMCRRYGRKRDMAHEDNCPVARALHEAERVAGIRAQFNTTQPEEDKTMTEKTSNEAAPISLRLQKGSVLEGKFQPVVSELYREYTFPGGETYRINFPQWLQVKRAAGPGDTDSHRLVDAAGVSHYVKPAEGWAISWKARDDAPHFLF